MKVDFTREECGFIAAAMNAAIAQAQAELENLAVMDESAMETMMVGRMFMSIQNKVIAALAQEAKGEDV